ncbi:MAG: PBSX family phage terminase large subunit [Clostridiales bacterium]|nr:PBSX family phage terminase large subunit [Clostridiales bacterium]
MQTPTVKSDNQSIQIQTNTHTQASVQTKENNPDKTVVQTQPPPKKEQEKTTQRKQAVQQKGKNTIVDQQTNIRHIYLPTVVGGGYGTFWNYTGRYRVLKGSRASKKSKTTALNLIWRIMRYPDANALVVRKVYRTLRDSCMAELKWAIERLGVQEYWETKETPLELCYRPTGQRIYFRGMDDPMKITSIAVSRGVLCWLWIEEAYEITRERDFDLLNESIRGAVSPPLFKQTTLTFNPWNEHHWLKKRFFDQTSPDILALTTDYRCNEFLDEADRRLFEEMKTRDPRRYRVAALGEWGVSEGLVYDHWDRVVFDTDEIRSRPTIRSMFGLDFGYTADPTALFCGLADLERKEIYVFDEVYARGLSNEAIFRELYERGYAKERIFADAAEPKSIDRLRLLGCRRITAARKGPDSIRAGIDFLREFHILIHPTCPSFWKEISSYTWQTDATGAQLNIPAPGNDHLMDAMRYAAEGLFDKGERFAF